MAPFDRVPISDVVKSKASTLKARAWTFEAKAIGPEAKAFKHTVRTEIHIIYVVHLTACQDRYWTKLLLLSIYLTFFNLPRPATAATATTTATA